ncbi:MAG TPA: hypothetical protein VIJ18_09155 [Microbacteriaceae bacterium]
MSESANRVTPAKAAKAAKPPLLLVSRSSTIIGLTVGATLNLGAALLTQAFLGPGGDFAAALSERPTLGIASALLNLVGIPLMLLGLTGLLYLSSPRAPISSRIALWATAIGMIAFLAKSAALAALYGAGAAAAPAVPTAILDSISGKGDPIPMVLALLFLAGNVIGILFASFAFFRSRIIPLWVTLALLVFLVGDFALPAVPWFDAHALFVVFAIGASIAVARTTRDAWRLGTFVD